MKKIILVTTIMLAGFLLNAQSLSYKNTLKIGVLAGAAVPKGNVAAGAGIDIAYQNLVTPHFGIGFATGYQHYFGRENTISGADIKNNAAGVIPISGLLRYYPKAEGIYVGADLGYGVIVGDENVTNHSAINTNRPTGGFYLKPEIGYHNKKWNIFVQYSKTYTGADVGKIADQKYNLGMLGVGLSYNIPLGR
ncbi:MAG: hypothetical protein ACK5NK_11225 [Niabella sp.]